MRKLYPQALRAEQSIQELRTQLLEAEAEGQGQRRQLLETDRQIRDLHGRLGTVEKQQRDFAHELHLVTLETQECSQQTHEAQSEAGALSKDIAAAERRMAGAEEMLAMAAALAERERELIALAGDDVSERGLQLAAVTRENEALERQLSVTRCENRGYEEELQFANRLSDEQAERVAEAREAWQQQVRRCEGATGSLRQLHEALEVLRQAARRENAELIRAEDLAAENTVMRESLDPRRLGIEEMTVRMKEAEAVSAEAAVELSRVEAETRELGKALATSEERVQDERWALDQAEDVYRTAESQLSSCRRECSLLQQNLTKAEVGRQHTETDVGARLKRLEGREAEMKSEQENLRALQKRLREEKAAVDEQTSSLEADLQRVEESNAAVLSRKTECMQRVVEMQNQPACTMS